MTLSVILSYLAGGGTVVALIQIFGDRWVGGINKRREVTVEAIKLTNTAFHDWCALITDFLPDYNNASKNNKADVYHEHYLKTRAYHNIVRNNLIFFPKSIADQVLSFVRELDEYTEKGCDMLNTRVHTGSEVHDFIIWWSNRLDPQHDKIEKTFRQIQGFRS